MAKKNSPQYWEERIALKTWGFYNTTEEKNYELLSIYQDVSRGIGDELYHLGQKLGKDGVLKRSDMYKQDRLEKLQRWTDQALAELAREIETFSKQNIIDGYKDCYGETRKQLGGINLALPGKKDVEKMMIRPWLGGTFSERLWKNTEALAGVLNDTMLRGIHQGKTTTEMAIKVSDAMQSGFHAAHRLVRTETMHYLNSAVLRGYRDSGVKKVQFWAAEDERTCEECGVDGLHGKIFDIDKAPILPIHPNCRCTYLPVLEDL